MVKRCKRGKIPWILISIKTKQKGWTYLTHYCFSGTLHTLVFAIIISGLKKVIPKVL